MRSLINDITSKDFRRELRNNLTFYENLLWQKLRRDTLGYRCRRQVSIGKYTVDFCFFEQKLIIEVDGVQHEERAGYDAERTRYLNNLGFTVLRFWNHEIRDSLESIVDIIYDTLHGE